jgi:hypothetical protein
MGQAYKCIAGLLVNRLNIGFEWRRICMTKSNISGVLRGFLMLAGGLCLLGAAEASDADVIGAADLLFCLPAGVLLIAAGAGMNKLRSFGKGLIRLMASTLITMRKSITSKTKVQRKVLRRAAEIEVIIQDSIRLERPDGGYDGRLYTKCS